MEEKIKILDESGDKKYFSQLPHYILNLSTANDQALYWQMKRYSGEKGMCFATEKTLMKKMGIGKKAYDKSLKYLLSKGWIAFIGTTKGKTRPIKTYSITDIWKLNIDHYEEISAESTLSFKEEISAERRGDKSQKQHKISPRSNVEEELVKEEHIKEDIGSPQAGRDINLLIDSFKEVNPSYEQLFKRPNQRAACQRLLAKHGPEKLGQIMALLPKTNSMQYAPVITTPIQLEDKLGSIIAFVGKEFVVKINNPKYIVL